MARISLPELVHEVALYSGVPEDRPTEIDSAVRVVLSAIALELPTIDRKALVDELPVELVELSSTEGDVFERVARELHLPKGPAIELTEAVLRVIGASVDEALRARLDKHLPKTLAEHLEGRPMSEPPPRSSVRAPEPPPPRHTLSSGRQGSAHPLSEAAPHVAHQHSVAANPAPHADGKLSSTRR